MIKIKNILLLNILLILLISCGKINNDTKTENIVINAGTEPRTIDPTLNNANQNASYILAAFEGLTIKDENGNIIPGCAERWDISDDGLIYTFYLRTNAKWSDGKPVTAHNFVYAWRRVVDPLTAAEYSMFLEPIKNAKEITAGEKNIEELGVKAIDDYTLEVTLNNPTLYFLDFTSYFTLCPIREDIIEKYGDTWTLNPESFIGNGAFKMSERKHDEKIVMIKNTNYWDSKNVKPEKITFIMMNDNTAALAGIKDGSIHLSKSVSRNTAEELKREGLIKTVNLLATYFLRVNVNSDVLKDIRVRKALALAIDKEYIVNNITLMNEIPAYNQVPNTVNNYDILRENNISNNYNNNIEEAKKLLAEAGYPNGKGFPVLDLAVPIRDAEAEVCEAIQSMWKDTLGIDVIVHKYDLSTFLQIQSSKNLKYLISSRTFADFDDPLTFLSLFTENSPINYLNYTNKEYDNLINIAVTNNNLKERSKLLYEAEKILIDDVAVIPLFYVTDVILISPKLKGIIYDQTGFMRFNNAYLEE